MPGHVDGLARACRSGRRRRTGRRGTRRAGRRARCRPGGASPSSSTQLALQRAARTRSVSMKRRRPVRRIRLSDRHGADGRAAPAVRLATQGGGFPTSGGREPRGERLELVLQRAERLAGRVGSSASTRPRTVSSSTTIRSTSASNAASALRIRRGTASCWASAATSRALPGSLPARTSASRRSTRSGGVSASASRSSRARSAACSSAASVARRARGGRRAGRGGADPALAAPRGLERVGRRRRRGGQRRRPQRARRSRSAPPGSFASARASTASNAGSPGRSAAARTGAPTACCSRRLEREHDAPGQRVEQHAAERVQVARRAAPARRGSAPARRSRASRPARRCGSAPALASSALTSPKSVRYA